RLLFGDAERRIATGFEQARGDVVEAGTERGVERRFLLDVGGARQGEHIGRVGQRVGDVGKDGEFAGGIRVVVLRARGAGESHARGGGTQRVAAQRLRREQLAPHARRRVGAGG